MGKSASTAHSASAVFVFAREGRAGWSDITLAVQVKMRGWSRLHTLPEPGIRASGSLPKLVSCSASPPSAPGTSATMKGYSLGYEVLERMPSLLFLNFNAVNFGGETFL